MIAYTEIVNIHRDCEHSRATVLLKHAIDVANPCLVGIGITTVCRLVIKNKYQPARGLLAWPG